MKSRLIRASNCDSCGKANALEHRQEFIHSDGRIRHADMLGPHRFDKSNGCQVNHVARKFIRVRASISYRSSASEGKSLRLQVTMTSAPAMIAAARTWRSSGSGNVSEGIRIHSP